MRFENRQKTTTTKEKMHYDKDRSLLSTVLHDFDRVVKLKQTSMKLVANENLMCKSYRNH